MEKFNNLRSIPSYLSLQNIDSPSPSLFVCLVEVTVNFLIFALLFVAVLGANAEIIISCPVTISCINFSFSTEPVIIFKFLFDVNSELIRLLPSLVNIVICLKFVVSCIKYGNISVERIV